MSQIGKIERVSLRDVWKHEALDFTTWLEDNVDVINEALGLSLVNVEREKTAGTFSVDLAGEDEAGNLAIIENQLEKSDHDHLGKLITYLTSLEAKVAVWIVKEPRPEHIRAISWLNECGAAQFYLVTIQAIRIGESPPAPLLTLITGPSEEAIEAGKAKKEYAERDFVRKRFWTCLLDQAKQKTKLHANISASKHHWVGTTAGLPAGIQLNYVVLRDRARIELYIDKGPGFEKDNEALLNELLKHKEEIEAEFGGQLSWEQLPGKRACRVSQMVENTGWDSDESEWRESHDKMISVMIRIERAMRPHL